MPTTLDVGSQEEPTKLFLFVPYRIGFLKSGFISAFGTFYIPHRYAISWIEKGFIHIGGAILKLTSARAFPYIYRHLTTVSVLYYPFHVIRFLPRFCSRNWLVFRGRGLLPRCP